jgi:uncharacterized protein YecE (DUF72 family)
VIDAPHTGALIAGCAVERMPGPKYSARLSFAELGPRAPFPRMPTLRRARYELPAEFVLSLRAPRAALISARGPLRFDDALERSFEWLLQARDALAAKIVVLPTPADLTPGQRDRDLLAALSERLPRDADRFWVWEPGGPWERDDAERLARSLGLLLAFDPLIDAAPVASVAYARLRALGARKSFSDAALEAVSAQLAALSATRSYVVVDAPRSFEHATRLQHLATTRGQDVSQPPLHDAR